MQALYLSNILSLLFAAVFGLVGVIHIIGPRFLRDSYVRAGYARQFHRVAGVLQCVAAVCLAIPDTRLWGVIFAEVIAFGAVMARLEQSRYVRAIPPMLVMIALPVAIFSSVFY